MFYPGLYVVLQSSRDCFGVSHARSLIRTPRAFRSSPLSLAPIKSLLYLHRVELLLSSLFGKPFFEIDHSNELLRLYYPLRACSLYSALFKYGRIDRRCAYSYVSFQYLCILCWAERSGGFSTCAQLSGPFYPSDCFIIDFPETC